MPPPHQKKIKKSCRRRISRITPHTPSTSSRRAKMRIKSLAPCEKIIHFFYFLFDIYINAHQVTASSHWPPVMMIYICIYIYIYILTCASSHWHLVKKKPFIFVFFYFIFIIFQETLVVSRRGGVAREKKVCQSTMSLRAANLSMRLTCFFF